MKLNFFFKINSKNYIPKDDIFNLFFINNNNINNKLFDTYTLNKKILNFDYFSILIFKNYLYFYLYKQYFFNNILIKYLFKTLYLNKMYNTLFNNYFLFNCCFYNYYIENIYFFFKQLSNDKNHFFWFFIRTFKKKKKKKIKKKRKKKFFKFKFKRRRFKFKRFRKHTKSFKFKKKKIRKENFNNLNLIFYYNYISKINNVKKINLKKTFKYKIKNNFLENNTIKTSKSFYKKNILFIFSMIKNKNKKIFYYKKVIKNLKLNFNMKFFKLNYFKFKFKLKKIKKYRFIKILRKINFIFLKNFYKTYGLFYNFFFNIYYNIILSKFFKKLNTYYFYKNIKLITKKKRKIIKRKKRWFSVKNKFFKIKKKYRYNVRTLFYKKHNIKKYSVNKYNPLLLKEFYKILFQSLLFNFKLTPSIFMFNSFSKYNIYNFSKLYNSKNMLIKFLKKNYRFFNTFKNDSINSLTIYNNHTPIYILKNTFIKKFRKIFKSYFSKKFSNHIYYYIIPMFEYFSKKKVFIKSFNLNIYKKKKYKKFFLYKRLLKIFKRNKAFVISRSIHFNIYELCEIILYSFYRKDAYLILNWFLRNFKDTHFTGHKSFLTFFKMVMNDIYESYKNTFRVKGFYFIIKGKVGVTSNAKKKTVKFVIGSISRSTKSQKIDFQQSVVKSISGSLGVSMILTY